MQITMEKIGYRYGARAVVRQVSARMESGLVYGVIGPNGSGKTTLLRLLAGVLTPCEGRVLLDGDEVCGLSARALAKRMAVVPQSSVLTFDFTVMDVVLMGRQPYIGRLGREQADDIEIAESAMRETGVYELRDRPATLLSGGEWQRTLIARALCQDTPVMLLDEPVSSLDIRHQLDILGTVRRRAIHSNSLVVMVLHDLNMAAHFCDRLLLMHEGRLASEGRPREVLLPDRLYDVYGAEVRILHGLDGQVDVLPRFSALT